MIKVNFLSYYLLVSEVGNGVFQSFPIGCLVFLVFIILMYMDEDFFKEVKALNVAVFNYNDCDSCI